jgi:signal transduction histidine kinase
MSSATHAPAIDSLHAEGKRKQPLAFLWAISVGWLVVFAWGIAGQANDIGSRALALIPWVVLIAVTNMLPVPGWKSAHLTVDLPIEVAAALVLTPMETGIVGFFGAFDIREFQGRISFTKAAFNRSQAALTYLGGSIAAHAISASPSRSSFILPLAFLVLTCIFVFNYVLVGFAISLEHGYPIRRVITRLRLGTLEDFGLTFLAWGVLGAMLAALYDQIHPWALVAFLGPTLLSRQVLMRSESFLDAVQAYRSREAILTEISTQIYEERSDERKLIAADLHDEVLQPLYKVTLMAHVLKADLASGHLLDIDDDLPQLLTAAEAASSSIRELIGDLRRSTLGRGGLARAISNLIRGLRTQVSVNIESRVSEVSAGAPKQLALYQVAKEALANALTHSQATNIRIELSEDLGEIHLHIRDDGIGFDPLTDREGHYGIRIMGERAQAIGGQLFVDSSPAHGCSVTLTVPQDKSGPDSPAR